MNTHLNQYRPKSIQTRIAEWQQQQQALSPLGTFDATAKIVLSCTPLQGRRFSIWVLAQNMYTHLQKHKIRRVSAEPPVNGTQVVPIV